MLSLVIPVYNEAAILPLTEETVRKVLLGASIDYEIVFVNDGSKDASWKVIQDLAQAHPEVRGVCFSRNFGKEAAIFAGLANAKGDCVVVMDCDLQDPPETIPQMYALWLQGYEIVLGVKKSRGKENAGYGLSSKLFNHIMSGATGVDMSRASDFRLLDARAVAVLLSIREEHMFFRAASSMIGFKQAEVEFDVAERTVGDTKWSKKSLFRYAITNITSYTIGPMKIIFLIGVLMFLLAIAQGLEAVIRYFLGEAATGFTTVILLNLIIGSGTMISLSIIGYYIARIFDEVRLRPGYIVNGTTENTREVQIQGQSLPAIPAGGESASVPVAGGETNCVHSAGGQAPHDRPAEASSASVSSAGGQVQNVHPEGAQAPEEKAR